MADLGTFSLRLALFLAVYGVVVDLLGSLRREQGLMQSATNAGWACWLCLSTAMTAMLIALAQGDFSIKYVAEHTSRALPMAYRLSALWAGSAGSLLLWVWLQTGISILAFSKASLEERNFTSHARAASNMVCCCFLVVLLFDREVFAVSLLGPTDGMGLNPLLQHPAMILHPLTLFMGYAGYVVPFAWAMATLARPQNQTRSPLLATAHNWALIAWLFLTIGNVLGSWWAYEELDWGGFWAWDPVENSSLMPWLIGTALLHCFLRYRPSSGISGWITILSLLSYSFCLFGRFLTKYGLVYSLHTFGEKGLGILYMILILVIWLIAAFLFIWRYRSRRTDTIKAMKHGDGTIVFTAGLLVSLTVAILLGSLFPFLSRLFTEQEITLQPEYFTKITSPGALLMLLLIGICPHLFRHGLNMNWRTALAGLTGVAAIICWFVFRVISIPCLVICAFVVLAIIADIFSRPHRNPEASQSPAPRPLGWYGARIAHLGVVMMFVGIAGAEGFTVDQSQSLRSGESFAAVEGKYELTFDSISFSEKSGYTAVEASVSINKNKEFLIVAKPKRDIYSDKRSYGDPHIYRTLAGDLYVALAGLNRNGELITLRVLVKPLINWLWLGGIVMVVGCLTAIFARRRARKTA